MLNNSIVPLSHYRKWLIPFQDEKTREFIRKARLAHGNENIYEYNFVKYTKSCEKICIYCKIHGEFWQTPNDHLAGKGCPHCGNIKRIKSLTWNTNDFILKSSTLHNNYYDYSKVEYKKNHEKVCIICPKHGEFWQTPAHHLQGHGCPECGKDIAASIPRHGGYTNNSLENNSQIFISKANILYNNYYDYSKVCYKGTFEKVCIICPKHGEFWQTPGNHLRKHGCPECGKETVSRKMTCDTEEFLNKCHEVHGDTYDYSKVDYIDCKTPVIIICPKHGEFSQLPTTHIHGCGCPMCGQQNLCESYVGDWLKNHNINNIHHYITDLIKISGHIIIDFKVIIDKKEIWVEFNGPQHYEFNYFHRGNIENFKNQLRRDEKVRNYCNKNGIRLIEIPYTYNTRESIFKFLDEVITKEVDPNTLVDYESLFKRPEDYKPYSENEDN